MSINLLWFAFVFPCKFNSWSFKHPINSDLVKEWIYIQKLLKLIIEDTSDPCHLWMPPSPVSTSQVKDIYSAALLCKPPLPEWPHSASSDWPSKYRNITGRPSFVTVICGCVTVCFSSFGVLRSSAQQEGNYWLEVAFWSWRVSLLFPEFVTGKAVSTAASPLPLIQVSHVYEKVMRLYLKCQSS